MALLPSFSPHLSLHLADSGLTRLLSSSTPDPILSDSRTSQAESNSQLDALTTLTSVSLSAYTSSAHLRLRLPRRVIFEMNDGPLLLHSFVAPLRRQKSEWECGGYTQNHPQEEYQDIPESVGEQNRMGHGALLAETSTASRLRRATTAESTEDGDPELSGSHDPQFDSHERARDLLDPDQGDDVFKSDDEEEKITAAPLLITTVLALERKYTEDAQKSVVELERVATGVQSKWAVVSQSLSRKD